MTWRRTIAVLPGIGVSLLPKLTCPLCWPAYAALLTTLGLGFLISARYLFVVTTGFLLISVAALAFRAGHRRGYGPAALGILASAIVLLGKFSMESNAVMYSGLAVLVIAYVWNTWPRRFAAGRCPQCVPSDNGLTTLNAQEKSS